MEIQTNKVILITGASSGIGAACAAHLARAGHNVYGTSRRVLDIDDLTMLQMDITDEAAVLNGVQTIIQAEGHLDVVINNAGIGIGGSIEDTALSEAQALFDTNFFGVLRVCKAALPVMRAQHTGLIINVSSIGGLMGLPYQGLYSASKFALEGMTEALRMEVKPFGVHVVLLEPGDIHTPFTTNRRSVQAAEASSVYEETYRRTLAKIEADEHNGATPEAVARAVARIIASPSPHPRYIVGPFYERLAAWLKRWIPARLFEWIIMKNYGL